MQLQWLCNLMPGAIPVSVLGGIVVLHGNFGPCAVIIKSRCLKLLCGWNRMVYRWYMNMTQGRRVT